MLLRDFKFSIILAVTTLVFAGVAAVGIRRYQESQPPDPRPISLIQEHAVISGLGILRPIQVAPSLGLLTTAQIWGFCADTSEPGICSGRSSGPFLLSNAGRSSLQRCCRAAGPNHRVAFLLLRGNALVLPVLQIAVCPARHISLWSHGRLRSFSWARVPISWP